VRHTLAENPYIICRYTTGDTVTITIRDLSDDSVIVNAASMTEIASTGYFKYQFNPSPAGLTEYIYITTNSIEEHAGKIMLGGYPNAIKTETDKIQPDIIDVPANYKADVAALPTAIEIDTQLSSTHGGGSWLSWGMPLGSRMPPAPLKADLFGKSQITSPAWHKWYTDLKTFLDLISS
jgi:hypothetical protein